MDSMDDWVLRDYTIEWVRKGFCIVLYCYSTECDECVMVIRTVPIFKR